MNAKITILIVDDNHQNLRVVSSFLKDRNYNLALATSGEKTIELLEKIETDLILLDIMMPEMDGLETCRIIKENPKTADIPVIFLTAKNQTEDIIEGFEAGGVDYITKPFNRDELLVRIKNHVDLAKAKKKIIEMNNTRDKLYSIIAHDIKSPLNSIIFTFNMINDGLFDTQSEHFSSIMKDLETSTKETKSLIENLLEWTKFQSENNQFFPAANNLHSIVSECFLLLNANASQKQIELVSDMDKNLKGWFDEVSIHTVLRNLINNSIKFTNAGGRIVVSAYKTSDDTIDVMVKDNGIGIKEEVRRKLFETGDVVSTMGTNNEKGTGLGIILVKDFVKKNNGNLKAESTPGEGTTITISLPAKETQTANV